MNRRIPYRIEFTRNKHSRAVIKDDTIVIRLAKNLSSSQRSQHVEELLRRMAKHAARELRRTKIDPFAPLLNGNDRLDLKLADGREYLVMLAPAEKTGFRQTSSGWVTHVGPGLRKRELHALLWKALSSIEREHMSAKVRLINGTVLAVNVRDVTLRHARSQWGSCSTSGTIMLNTALLFVPEPLQEYVIVHELTHRLHPDHSTRYWNRLASVMPDYEERKASLRQFRLPIL